VKKEKIKVLFENENLLVLDKPAGFAVHGDGKTIQPTIADYVIKNFKKIKGVGDEGRPGIVHRLDKDTTGCLVIAKNQNAYNNLKHQFQERKVKKEYVALVWGNVRQETGMIDSPIARSKSDFRKKSTVTEVMVDGEIVSLNARDALTRYKVLKRIELFGEKLTLVTFFPETGRTHQIRIHSKSIGHPIVADHLYGPRKGEFEKKYFRTARARQLLHAKSITLHNPESGEMIKVESPLSKDFKNVL
jgi:23S rRNA pseudouridine1911/1915/1917 synthase